MNAITYIFSGGRGEKLSREENIASDFFYGFLELKKDYEDTHFIELENNETNFFDKLIIKLTKLPIYFNKILSIKNFKILKSSKYIICINETSYLTSLPLIIVFKLVYNKKVFFFPMGLVDKYLDGNFLSKFLITFSLKFSNKVYFIGKGEMLSASRHMQNQSKKFEYIPFSVDTNFWKGELSKTKLIKNILFIGNDNNRDYKLLNNLIKNNRQYDFTVITNNNQFVVTEDENLFFTKGDWRSHILTDEDILNEYRKADLVVLPIKNTTQPSGQSVALQAMATNTPVMITKTKGFWDNDKFQDKKNIIFLADNSLSRWSESIKYYSEDISLLNSIANNGNQTVEEFHNIEKFSKYLNTLIVSN